MPGFNGNVLEFQRRDARHETAAGIAGQNKKFLKIKPTRRRQLFKCRWQCRAKRSS
jgi:hypothetical protein